MLSYFEYKYFLYKLISKLNPFNEINGIRALMYHSVGSEVENDIFKIYNVSPELFKKYINFLIKKNINILKLSKEILNDNISGTLITFDDGYLNNYEIVEPILTEFNISFTVFVTANYINKDSFLSSEKLKKLSIKDNVTIGAHGLNHLHLVNLNDVKLYEELYTSKLKIEEVIQKEVYSISYPHGSIDMRVRDIAEKVGFTIGFTSWPNINYFDRDPLLLSRNVIWSNDDEEVLGQKIIGKWDWMRLRHKDPLLK